MNNSTFWMLAIIIGFLTGCELPENQPSQSLPRPNPVMSHINGGYLILRGVVDVAEDVGNEEVRISLYDDANCTHVLRLKGKVDDFYVGEYNRIFVSHHSKDHWGVVEEVWMGED